MKNTEKIGNFVRAYKCSSCGNVSFPHSDTFFRYSAVQHEVCPKCGGESAYIPIVGQVYTVTKHRMFKEDEIEQTFIEKLKND